MAKSVTMYFSGSEDTATGDGGFQVTASNILTVFGNKIKVEDEHIDVGINWHGRQNQDYQNNDTVNQISNLASLL